MKHPANKQGGVFTPTPISETALRCIDCGKALLQPWEIYQTVQHAAVVRPLCAVCFDRRRGN